MEPGSPRWWESAIVYCLDVAIFDDSDGDGVGDIAGLRRRLDYLQELGVTCLWLLPLYASPHRDDGYDVTDHCAIDPRIGTLEDEELEVMEDLELAEGELRAVTADLDALRAELEHVTAARDAAFETIDAEIASLGQDRETTVPGVPDDLLALYDKVRAQYGGLGAAALRARRCEGCRLEINGADLREIAAQPEDDVVRCPECSRILVRTAESGL